MPREKGYTVVGPLYRDPRPAAQLLISSAAHQSLVHDHRLVKSRPPYRRNPATLLLRSYLGREGTGEKERERERYREGRMLRFVCTDGQLYTKVYRGTPPFSFPSSSCGFFLPSPLRLCPAFPRPLRLEAARLPHESLRLRPSPPRPSLSSRFGRSSWPDLASRSFHVSADGSPRKEARCRNIWTVARGTCPFPVQRFDRRTTTASRLLSPSADRSAIPPREENGHVRSYTVSARSPAEKFVFVRPPSRFNGHRDFFLASSLGKNQLSYGASSTFQATCRIIGQWTLQCYCSDTLASSFLKHWSDMRILTSKKRSTPKFPACELSPASSRRSRRRRSRERLAGNSRRRRNTRSARGGVGESSRGLECT